jgi:hypothetical protein
MVCVSSLSFALSSYVVSEVPCSDLTAMMITSAAAAAAAVRYPLNPTKVKLRHCTWSSILFNVGNVLCNVTHNGSAKD